MGGGETLQPGDPRIGRTQEQNKLVNSRLRVFADLRSGETQGDTGRRIVDHIRRLSEVGASRQVVQMAVSSITRELLTATVEQLQRDDILLVPVLRAGVAMWSTANEFFGFPETSFIWGKKEKGTDRASVLWPKRNVTDGRHVLVLDPIIATGDTLIQVSESIAGARGTLSLTVLSCYAAPEGIQAILDKTQSLNLVIGCISETVDANGYLVPPTHGDMGDKLFGLATEI